MSNTYSTRLNSPVSLTHQDVKDSCAKPVNPHFFRRNEKSMQMQVHLAR